MPTLQFSASDPSVVLIGAIFHAADATSQDAILQYVRVLNGVSEQFIVPSTGPYRYEFNIHGTVAFTLSLASLPGGTPVSCYSGPFDPNDPALGHGASIDRKSFFIV
jgi:hypothetical protein